MQISFPLPFARKIQQMTYDIRYHYSEKLQDSLQVTSQRRLCMHPTKLLHILPICFTVDFRSLSKARFLNLD